MINMGTAADVTSAISQVKAGAFQTNAFVDAAASNVTKAVQAFSGADTPWYKSPWVWGGVVVVAGLAVGGVALMRSQRQYSSKRRRLAFGEVGPTGAMGPRGPGPAGRSDVRSPTSTSTEVRSPTSTSTEVRSPTSTSTEVRSPTSTSTDAYTSGNITVTGGAGDGANTSVTVYSNGCNIDPVSKAGKAKARERAMMDDAYRKGLSPTGASARERAQMAMHTRTGKSKTGASARERGQMAWQTSTGKSKSTRRRSATSSKRR